MSNKIEFKVAIIGAGIGGASAAHFLRSIFNKQVQITIYEKSGEIGGRIKSVKFVDQYCETGATVLHSTNKYMIDFAKQLGLPLVNLSNADQRLIIVDSKNQLEFSSLEGCKVLAFGKTLWRYKLDLNRIHSYVTSMVKNFTRIYRLQDEGYCFTTTARLLAAIKPEFVEMTTHTYHDWLKTKLNLKTKVYDELVCGLMHFHYGQGMDANAFAGLINLISTLPGIYTVETGNQQIPQKLVQQALANNSRSENQNIIYATVKKIEHVDQLHKYKLTFEDSQTGAIGSGEFDYVIIACPVNQVSDLEYVGNNPLPFTPFIEMDRVLYYGKIRKQKTPFGPEFCEKNQWITVLRSRSETSNVDIPWGMMHTPVKNPEPTGRKMIWLASTDPKQIKNPETRIRELYFEEKSSNAKRPNTCCEVTHWYACPIYQKVKNPEQDLGSFIIAPGLFYLNALENAASCMEISAIAGRNVALLLAHSRNSVYGQYGFGTHYNVRVDESQLST